MAQFPIEYSQKIPQAGQYRQADFGGELVGQAIARAGGLMVDLGSDLHRQQIKREAEIRKNKIYTETQNGKIAIQQFDSETKLQLRDISDPDEIAKVSVKRLEERNRLYEKFATLDESRQNLDLYTRETAIGQYEAAENTRYERAQENAFIAFDGLYQAAAREGNFESLEPLARQAYHNKVITDKQYTKYADDVHGLVKKWNYEKIRKLTQDSVGPDGDKKEGYAILVEAEKQGIIDAEDRKLLGDSLDNFVAGQFESQKQAKYTAKIESMKSFVDAIRKNELTFEAIGNSPLESDEKEMWGNFLKNAYVQPPETATHAGVSTATNVVLQYSQQQISDKEAYELLMTERYGKNSLSPDVFDWAVSRIENPYPKPFTPILQTVVNSNENDYNGWYKSAADKEKSKIVNLNLLNWIEEFASEGQYPTAAELKDASDLYRAGRYPAVDKKRKIGDAVEKGGKTWIIVDFRADGTPMVEEAK